MLILACDHAGVGIKNAVKSYLTQNGIEFTDCGTETTDAVDYPVYAKKALDLMQDKENDIVLLFCGTGLGMMLCANRVPGVRAVCASDAFSVEHSRSHNNANVLCLGGRVIDEEKAVELVKIFLYTKFDGDRHAKRLKQIEELFS